MAVLLSLMSAVVIERRILVAFVRLNVQLMTVTVVRWAHLMSLQTQNNVSKFYDRKNSHSNKCFNGISYLRLVVHFENSLIALDDTAECRLCHHFRRTTRAL